MNDALKGSSVAHFKHDPQNRSLENFYKFMKTLRRDGKRKLEVDFPKTSLA